MQHLVACVIVTIFAVGQGHHGFSCSSDQFILRNIFLVFDHSPFGTFSTKLRRSVLRSNELCIFLGRFLILPLYCLLKVATAGFNILSQAPHRKKRPGTTSSSTQQIFYIVRILLTLQAYMEWFATSWAVSIDYVTFLINLASAINGLVQRMQLRVLKSWSESTIDRRRYSIWMTSM